MKKTFIIGITGGTAAGKTEVLKRLEETFGSKIAVISQDNYYKDLEHLSKERWERADLDTPDAMDNHLLVEHLKKIQQGKAIEVPIYDFKNHSRAKERIKISATAVIIVEGLFVLTVEEIRDLLDLRVFLDSDPDIRLARRLLRDINTRGLTLEELSQNLQWYLEKVKPNQEKWVLPYKKFADLVLNTNSGVAKATEKLIEVIREKLKKFD